MTGERETSLRAVEDEKEAKESSEQSCLSLA